MALYSMRRMCVPSLEDGREEVGVEEGDLLEGFCSFCDSIVVRKLYHVMVAVVVLWLWSLWCWSSSYTDINWSSKKCILVSFSWSSKILMMKFLLLLFKVIFYQGRLWCVGGSNPPLFIPLSSTCTSTYADPHSHFTWFVTPPSLLFTTSFFSHSVVYLIIIVHHKY